MGEILTLIRGLTSLTDKIQELMKKTEANEEERTELIRWINRIFPVLENIGRHPQKWEAYNLMGALNDVWNQLRSALEVLIAFEQSNGASRFFQARGMREEFKTMNRHLDSALQGT